LLFSKCCDYANTPRDIFGLQLLGKLRPEVEEKDRVKCEGSGRLPSEQADSSTLRRCSDINDDEDDEERRWGW
jgi:hypothetical protein